MLYTETHKYDGLVGQIYQKIVQQDHRQCPSFEESIQFVEQCLARSNLAEKAHILHAINLLKNDHQGNDDRSNNIKVEELLPRVINIIRLFDASGIDLFLQNLGEISQLGACPQGRTTRLLGFYIPYMT
jgi:hypothetical protein